MRIVHVTHQFPPETHGGVETYVMDVASEQRARGHHVEIVSGSVQNRERVESSFETVADLPVHRIHRNDLFFDAWDGNDCVPASRLVLEKIEAAHADVVHLHHWIRLSRDLVTRIEQAGIPVVVTLHDLVTSCPRAFRMRPPDDVPCDRPLGVASCLECVPRRPWQDDAAITMEIEAYQRCSVSELLAARAVICSTASIRALIAHGVGIPEERVEVLPLGYRARFSAAPAAPGDGVFRFAYWGSITHRKGVDLLIDAFRSVVGSREPAHPELELHLFGRIDLPGLEAELRRRAEGLPVSFHGRFEYDDIPASGVDCAVFPSRCIETYGIVLDEAFELGLPVIVSDIGAFAERAGGGGLTFGVSDAGDLARALGAVAFDPSVRTRLEASRPDPSPSPSVHLDGLQQIYARAIAAPPRENARRPGNEDAAEHVWERMRRQFERLIQLEGPGTP